MYYRTSYDSPIGAITLACADGRLAGLWFNGQKYYGDSVPEPMIPNDDLPVFHMAKNWLDRYFSGQRPDVDEAAARADWRRVQTDGMAHPARDSLWRGDNLRRNCKTGRGENGPANVGPGSWRRGGP